MNNSTKNFIKKSLLPMLIIKTFLFIDITFAANLTGHSEVKEDIPTEDIPTTVNAGQDMKKPIHNVQNHAHTMKEDFKTLAQDIKAEVKEKVSHTAEKVKEKLTDLKEDAHEKAHTAKEYIKIGTCVATEAIKEKAHDLNKKAKELESTGQEKIKKAQKAVNQKPDIAKDMFKDKLKDTVEHAKSSFEDTKEAIKKANQTTFKHPVQKSNRYVKKNLKIVLKNVKKRKLALIEKLTEELINYELELQKRVAQGLTKAELEKDTTLLKLKKAIETTEYELAFLEKKYNTLWAKTYPTLAKLTCGLQAKLRKEKNK